MGGYFGKASAEASLAIRAAARQSRTPVPQSPPSLSQGRATYMQGAASSDPYADFRSWVYVCIAAIMRRVSSQPLYVGKAAKSGAKATGPKVKLPRYLRQKVPSGQVDIADDHPILDIFAKPNVVQNCAELLGSAVASLELTGSAYFVGGASKDSPTGYEVWAVPTHWIIPDHSKGPFSGFKMRTAYGEAVDLPPGSVCRLHFPDPANPLGSWSPYKACLQAVKVDSKMQVAQEQAFDMGPYPQVAIRVGSRRDANGVERRPVLSGKQRKALIRAVRTVWNNTAGVGDPAVLDGLIEGVDKLSLLPSEMGFETSGQITKERVFLTFGVNPIVVGQVTSVNKAQAVVAEASFCSNAVNPLLQAISEALTAWICPWFADGTLLWFDPAAPIDDELKLRAWTTSRNNGDIDANEWRTEILGLPEREEVAQRNDLLNTVGGMTGSVAILEAAGQGMIQPSQASALLELFLGIDTALADEIAGVGMEPVEPDDDEGTQKPPLGLPAPQNDSGGSSSSGGSQDPEDPEDAASGDQGDQGEGQQSGDSQAGKSKAVVTRDRRSIARRAIEAIHVKALENHEEGLAAELAKFFRGTASADR